MPRTYELYLRRANGHVQFEALTHRGSIAELMRRVRGMLDLTDAEAIEVREGGQPLFTVLATDSRA